MTKSYIYRPKAPLDKYPYARKFPKPIEVFCPQEYPGYYVRGQGLDFPYECPGVRETDPVVYYQLRLLVLVNDSFDNIKFNLGSLRDQYRFGKIIGRTEREFESVTSIWVPQVYPAGNKEFKQEKLPVSLTIDLKNIGLIENEYLKGRLQEKPDIIFVNLVMVPTVEVDPVTRHARNTCPEFSYPFVACYFDSAHYMKDEVRAWFGHLYDTFCFELDYKGISKKEFFRLLDMVGTFSHWAIWGEKIISDYIRQLYEFFASVSDSQDPLVSFCFSFLDDLLDDLYRKKIIGRCASCGNAFIFDKKKKYCSLLSEGKNCGKSARNKTYYQRYLNKVKLKKRQGMAEWRSYLKERKVKKPPPKSRKKG